MKNLFTLILFFFPLILFSQDTSHAFAKKKDSTGKNIIKRDITKKIIRNKIVVKPATSQDSAIQPVITKKDSTVVIQKVSKTKKNAISWQQDTAFVKLFYDPYFKKNLKPLLQIDIYHRQPDKELLFYILTALITFLAYIKTAFTKYFKNLFSQLVRGSQKKQLSESIQQNNFPALFLNLLFFVTAGLLTALFINIYLHPPYPFWIVLIYCICLIAFIYSGKYLVIKLSGWVFNNDEAASAYTSLVFFINKVFGLTLVPLLLIFAFAGAEMFQVLKTIVIILLIAAFAYRYIASLSILQHSVKMNAVQFFVYFCTIELIPLLVFYKFISTVTSDSY